MSKYVEDLFEQYKKEEFETLKKGFHEGTVRLYTDEEIESFRTICDIWVPASIILLCYELCVGDCHNRALLLARILLNTDDEIYLITADINGLKLHPEIIRDDDEEEYKYQHSFVYRKTKDGKEYIYDTTHGYVFDKNVYWGLENPMIRKILGRKSIKDAYEAYVKRNHDENKLNSIVAAAFIEEFKDIDKVPHEPYSDELGGPLQKEFELLKEKIGYDTIKTEKREHIDNVKRILFRPKKKED